MTQQEIETLMRSSQTESEWNINCDKVKAACGGYPNFWYSAIILSGLCDKVASRWGGDARIRIEPL